MTVLDSVSPRGGSEPPDKQFTTPEVFFLNGELAAETFRELLREPHVYLPQTIVKQWIYTLNRSRRDPKQVFLFSGDNLQNEEQYGRGLVRTVILALNDNQIANRLDAGSEVEKAWIKAIGAVSLKAAYDVVELLPPERTLFEQYHPGEKQELYDSVYNAVQEFFTLASKTGGCHGGPLACYWLARAVIELDITTKDATPPVYSLATSWPWLDQPAESAPLSNTDIYFRKLWAKVLQDYQQEPPDHLSEGELAEDPVSLYLKKKLTFTAPDRPEKKPGQLLLTPGERMRVVLGRSPNTLTSEGKWMTAGLILAFLLLICCLTIGCPAKRGIDQFRQKERELLQEVPVKSSSAIRFPAHKEMT